MRNPLGQYKWGHVEVLAPRGDAAVLYLERGPDGGLHLSTAERIAVGPLRARPGTGRTYIANLALRALITRAHRVWSADVPRTSTRRPVPAVWQSITVPSGEVKR